MPIDYKVAFPICPQCGKNDFDPDHFHCRHCLECGFIACMHEDEELAEIIANSKYLNNKNPKNN